MRNDEDGQTGGGRTKDGPFDRIIDLISATDLLAIGSSGIDTARRSVDSLIETAENFARTMDNLNATTVRVNALLDEIEEPLKRVLAQMGPGLGVMANVGDNAAALADVLKRLSPLASLAEGASALLNGRPSTATQTAAPTSPSSAPAPEAGSGETPGG